MASVCYNGVLKMWSLQTATQLASMRIGSRVKGISFSSDGAYLVALTDTDRSRIAVFKVHKGIL